MSSIWDLSNFNAPSRKVTRRSGRRNGPVFVLVPGSGAWEKARGKPRETKSRAPVAMEKDQVKVQDHVVLAAELFVPVADSLVKMTTKADRGLPPKMSDVRKALKAFRGY